MARKMAVLAFHGIGEPQRDLEPGEASLWLDPTQFAQILDIAVTHGGSVELTFDDGNASDVELAFPMLLARGVSAQLFVLAGRLDAERSLSRDDLRTLQEAGMTIGTHGLRQQPWRTSTERELREELVEARHILASVTDRAITETACPQGSDDRRVLRRLRSCGYGRVFTGDGGRTVEGRWLQARHSLSASDVPEHIARLIASGSRGTSLPCVEQRSS